MAYQVLVCRYSPVAFSLWGTCSLSTVRPAAMRVRQTVHFAHIEQGLLTVAPVNAARLAKTLMAACEEAKGELDAELSGGE